MAVALSGKSIVGVDWALPDEADGALVTLTLERQDLEEMTEDQVIAKLKAAGFDFSPGAQPIGRDSSMYDGKMSFAQLIPRERERAGEFKSVEGVREWLRRGCPR